MERYDLLYKLYDEYDTASVRASQDSVDLFPPVDPRVALDYWQNANEELSVRHRSDFGTPSRTQPPVLPGDGSQRIRD